MSDALPEPQPADLDEWQMYLDATTPGVWDVGGMSLVGVNIQAGSLYLGAFDSLATNHRAGWDNASFTIYTRNNLQTLLNEVRALRIEVVALKAERAAYKRAQSNLLKQSVQRKAETHEQE